ncbi:MAG: hypothetical protein O2794_01085 [bacterium]|nr:hypothetical protein [bacterium]
MIFSRKPSEEPIDPQNHKRIVSDIRPAYGKLPTMAKRTAQPTTKPREIFKRGPQPSGPKNPVIRTLPPKLPQQSGKLPPVPPHKIPKVVLPDGGPGFKLTRAKALTFLTPVAIVIVLGGYFFWSSSLTLEITPKKTAFEIPSDLKIELPAEAFTASVTKRGDGKSLEEESFSEKASGILLVFNDFNSQSQILVKNTRFEAPNGLIYRSMSRIVVPGKEGDAPGATEVTVVASEPGDKYNIGLTDFTIPGFEGSPRFAGFFARSKTELVGGKAGFGKIVGADEAEELLSQLESEMTNELQDQLSSIVPDSHISFPESYEPSTAVRITDPAVGSPADEFFAEVRGEIKTLGIDKVTFSEELAEMLFKDQYAAGAYRLREDDGIRVSDVRMNFDLGTVSLTMSGKATFEWLFDQGDLQNKVLEAENHKDLKGVFDSYPGISRVEQTFRPALLKKIPSSPDRLIIEIKS